MPPLLGLVADPLNRTSIVRGLNKPGSACLHGLRPNTVLLYTQRRQQSRKMMQKEGDMVEEKMASRPADSRDMTGNGGRRQAMAAIRPITLVDQVVEAFIHAAAEGRILPGDRVVEADIASALQVSRVPVRE